MQTNNVKPGFLVALSTSIAGNVSYVKQDLEAESIGTGARVKWETTRFTNDLAEHEAAIKARGRAVAIVRSQCSIVGQGTLMCPESNEAQLESAIAEARRIVSEFNSMARLSQINFSVWVGKLVSDDAETMRGINNEVRILLDQMASGVKALNAKAIRDAANKATQLGQMLTPEAKGRVNFAIDKARQAARQIVKSGEQAAKAVDQTVIARLIGEQRVAFLDLDAENEIATPEAEAVAVDLEPLNSDLEVIGQPEAPVVQLESEE